MYRVTARLSAPFLGLALLMPGCASAPAAPRLVDASGQLCPGAGTFDVTKIKTANTAEAAERAAWITQYTAITPLPPGAEAAKTRIRVRVPPTGMWGQDSRVTLWKAAGGAWQIATDNKGPPSPPPPPPPPPPVDANGNRLPGFENWQPSPPPLPPPPYLTSALSPEIAAELDTALADPCFVNGPDSLPYSVPYGQADEHGRDVWLCPPDSATYMAEVKQPGLPTRYISHACYMDFAVSTLLTRMTYLKAAPASASD